MYVKTLLALVLTCSSVAYGQETQPTQSIPGGYNTVSIKDAGVQAAAKFAVEQMQQGSLVKIVAAQMQVVAGKNYSLQLILSQNGVSNQFNVTVFVPLPNSGQQMQLTDVAAMGEVDTSTSNDQSTTDK